MTETSIQWPFTWDWSKNRRRLERFENVRFTRL
jgi:hypothetical protein